LVSPYRAAAAIYIMGRARIQGQTLDRVVAVSFRASTSDQLLISFIWMPR
jgi:hypothetical protein